MIKERKFTILNVFDVTVDYFLQFCKTWKVWFSYSLALTFLGALSGNWSHSCKDTISMSWWCADVSNAYFAYARMIIYFIGAFFLIFAFCYDVYNGKKNFASIFSVTREKLKFMGFVISLCVIFFASLSIDVWLIFRKANPQWLVEFGFFLIVFSLATLAVLILRTSASLGLFLQSGKMFDFKELFKLTHAKFYVILLTFCVITYAVNVLQMHVMRSLEVWNLQKPHFWVVLTSEFLSSLLKFSILAVYTAYFLAQARCLIPGEFVNSEEPEQKDKKTVSGNLEQQEKIKKPRKKAIKTDKKSTHSELKKARKVVKKNKSKSQ